MNENPVVEADLACIHPSPSPPPPFRRRLVLRRLSDYASQLTRQTANGLSMQSRRCENSQTGRYLTREARWLYAECRLRPKAVIRTVLYFYVAFSTFALLIARRGPFLTWSSSFETRPRNARINYNAYCLSV